MRALHDYPGHLKPEPPNATGSKRMDMGNLQVDPSDFDMVECVTELAESFAPIYDQKSQKLHLATPPGKALIFADKNRIMQVITNLLSNASKYSPESRNVWLRVAKVDDHLAFEVKDEGFGISQEDQKKMFNAFFRVDSEETRSIEGTGLGLGIAKGIVEIHGGQMEMESEPGEGTTFSFEIHNLEADSPEDPKDEEKPVGPNAVAA